MIPDLEGQYSEAASAVIANAAVPIQLNDGSTRRANDSTTQNATVTSAASVTQGTALEAEKQENLKVLEAPPSAASFAEYFTLATRPAKNLLPIGKNRRDVLAATNRGLMGTGWCKLYILHPVTSTHPGSPVNTYPGMGQDAAGTTVWGSSLLARCNKYGLKITGFPLTSIPTDYNNANAKPEEAHLVKFKYRCLVLIKALVVGFPNESGDLEKMNILVRDPDQDGEWSYISLARHMGSSQRIWCARRTC